MLTARPPATRRRRWLGLLAVLAVITAAGVGRDSGPSARTSSHPPPTTTTTPGAPAATVAPAPTPSARPTTGNRDRIASRPDDRAPLTVAPADLFSRHGSPPDNVSAQTEIFIGGDGLWCENGQSNALRIEVEAHSFAVPTDVGLVFCNFDPTRLLTVTVEPPGRATSTVVLPPTLFSLFSYLYRRLPGDPIGRYKVTARQGPATASTAFTIRRATKPVMLLSTQEMSRSRPSDVRLYLGGFPSSTRTTLHLYVADPGLGLTYTYRTSFTAEVGRHGEAVILFRIKARTATGCYLFDRGTPSPGRRYGSPTSVAILCIRK